MKRPAAIGGGASVACRSSILVAGSSGCARAARKRPTTRRWTGTSRRSRRASAGTVTKVHVDNNQAGQAPATVLVADRSARLPESRSSARRRSWPTRMATAAAARTGVPIAQVETSVRRQHRVRRRAAGGSRRRRRRARDPGGAGQPRVGAGAPAREGSDRDEGGARRRAAARPRAEGRDLAAAVRRGGRGGGLGARRGRRREVGRRRPRRAASPSPSSAPRRRAAPRRRRAPVSRPRGPRRSSCRSPRRAPTSAEARVAPGGSRAEAGRAQSRVHHRQGARPPASSAARRSSRAGHPAGPAAAGARRSRATSGSPRTSRRRSSRRCVPGQKATIDVDALGGKEFKGHVDSIAAATGAKFSLLPPENATGNYVKVVQRIPVRIFFEPGQDPDHLLRPGMSVTPTVTFDDRWPRLTDDLNRRPSIHTSIRGSSPSR